VPLVIRWPAKIPAPKGYQAGQVTDRFIEAIDLGPTMLSLAGAEKPKGMQGQVFLGDKSEAPRQMVFGARDRCDETVFRFRTVRDARYRYIRNFTPERPFLQANDYKERSYPVWNLLKELHAQGKLTPVQEVLCQPTMPSEELYDLEADPHEIKNLATSSDPVHVAKLKELRASLEKWIDESNDQGKTLEPQEVAAARGSTKKESDPNAGSATRAKRTGKGMP
jgi:arylsulfatase A-like enzyme